MSITTESMTPADIAAVTNNTGNCGAYGGEWFIWIVLFFLLAGGGWNNGYGRNNGGSDIANQYVLNSDFATLQRQLSDGFNSMERKGDSISNGLCDGFYAQNTTMLNGFAGVNSAIATNGYETINAIQNAQITNMQNANALQSQLAQCCCDNKSAIADVKYAMSMNANNTDRTIDAVNYNLTTQASGIGRQLERGFADTNYNMATNTCNITQEIHKVGDRIIEYMVNDKNQTLRDENQALRLSASQSAQNNYLISQLRPQPSPAYVVPNPYCNCNNGCGCNSGCGC